MGLIYDNVVIKIAMAASLELVERML